MQSCIMHFRQKGINLDHCIDNIHEGITEAVACMEKMLCIQTLLLHVHVTIHKIA